MTEEKLQEITAAARKEYYRQWRMNHREACRKHDHDYWQRRALKAIQLDNERRQAVNGGNSIDGTVK